MGWMPSAIRKPVPRYQAGGSAGGAMPSPRRLVLHTAVSSADSLFDLFNRDGNPVAHFYVRADGTIEQYVDTSRRASAVLEGNGDCVTVESEDIGPPFPGWTGSNVPPWTDAQLDALARIARYCHSVHAIPLVAVDASPGSHGVSWHRKGIDGNFPAGLLSGRGPGDEHWSSSGGKVCPGDNRIRQVVGEVLPRALAGGDDDEMTPEDRKFLDARFDRIEKRLNAFRENSAERDKATRQTLSDLGDQLDKLETSTADDATRVQVVKMRKQLREGLAKLGEEAPADPTEGT